MPRWDSNLFVTTLLGSLLSGCGFSGVEGTSPGDCGDPVRGAEALLRPGALVLVGEIHGTREAPAFLGDLACRAVREGIPVRVGLEIPVGEENAMRGWFAPQGKETAGSGLWESPFFRKDYQDGRSSAAMAELMRRVREWHRQGRDAELFFFDPGDGRDRDRLMAENIAAARSRDPGSLLLILTGNLHAKKEKGTPFSGEFVPTGYHLAGSGNDVTALKVLTAAGTAWMCNGGTPDTCGRRRIGGKDLGGKRFVEIGGEGMPHGYDGIAFLGPATASEPLKDAGAGSPGG